MNPAIAFWPIVTAYLLGAIPFGLLVAKAHGIRDLRRVGSGNIGATNVSRAIGFRAAIWVYLLDIGKGTLAVALAELSTQTAMPREYFLLMAALAAMLGHIFPVYLGFKGGKGVNTALGTMLMIMPIQILISLGVFLLVVLISRYVSLGSICAALVFGLTPTVQKLAFGQTVPNVYFLTAIVVALLVFLTHLKNIKRLLAGTETKFVLSAHSDRGGGGG